MKYYGQWNEDKWIEQYCLANGLEIPSDGLVVDIGCGDGLHSSNSRHWLLRGMKGFLLDGNIERVMEATKLYEDNDLVRVARGIVWPEDTLVEMDRTGWWATRNAKPSLTGIPPISALGLFRELDRAWLVSIDIEDMTYHAVEALLMSLLEFEWLIVEANDREAREKMRNILGEEMTRLDCNLIYRSHDV